MTNDDTFNLVMNYTSSLFTILSTIYLKISNGRLLALYNLVYNHINIALKFWYNKKYHSINTAINILQKSRFVFLSQWKIYENRMNFKHIYVSVINK